MRRISGAFLILLCLNSACKNSTPDTTHSIAVDVSGRLAFQSDRSGNFEIYFTRSSGTALDNISQNIFGNTNPSLSLDGNKLVYLSDRDTVRNIYLFQNSTTTRLLPTLANYDAPRISYAGDEIVFVRNFNIYVMTSNGTGVTALTSTGNDTANFSPAFSFDGSSIVFVRTVQHGYSDIYRMSSLGGAVQNLTGGVGDNRDPSFSPDGKEIVFSRADHICILTLANKNVLDLMPHDSLNVNMQPVFSPDGSSIAFVTNRDGNMEIYTMGRDGTNLKNISDHEAVDLYPTWSR
jgi:Tol biopolymer transport system component